MKTLPYRIIGLLSLATGIAGATAAISILPESYDVVVRKKNGSFEIAPREFEGLRAPETFETDHFRIVWKKEEAPLTLARIDEIVEAKRGPEKDNPLWADRDADRIRLLAANTLYHAEIARKYFVDVVGSKAVAALEPIVIRLDLTNQFSQYARFANDNLSPQFNNALSIEGGKPLRPKPGEGPWQREIWFRPQKKIPIREILAAMPENPLNPQIRQARQILYPMQIDSAVRDAIYAVFQSGSSRYVENVTRQAGTFLLMEGGFQVLKLVNRVLIPQTFYLESAAVPEIIYHEFAHIALSDAIHLDASTPVNEGMADFFAANIADSPKLAKKIRAFSTGISKNGKKAQIFKISDEASGSAQSDFVLSLLWGLRDVLGERTALKVVYGAHDFLSTRDSDIRSGLAGAIFKSCALNCEDPMNDRLKIHLYLQDRGL